MIMNTSQEKDEMEVDYGQDSDKGAGSSNDETDSDSGSESEGDEDLGEEDYIKMKGEKSLEMTDIEKQFLALKEQYYYERLSEVEHRMKEVKEGKAEEYLQPLNELEEAMRNRTEVAAILRDLKLANVKCQHDAEMVAARQNMQSESQLIIESLKQDIEEKLRKLEEDRNTIDNEFFTESFKKRHNYSYVDVGPMGRDQMNLPDRRRKPVSVTGPFVVYMLDEKDILEDYKAIRNAVKSPSSYYYF
jgi:breast cancer metastasis-suppressor 1-like protein